MQQTEQFIQAISQYFDQSVATASDVELFAAGYLRGLVDLGVGRLLVAAQPFVAADIISLVDESVKEVRTVSHQMMPNMLLKSGLAKAVAEFLDKIDQRIIKVNLYTEGLNERIEENSEIVLYRVMQECVNNVIKHSAATQLDISLIKDKDGVSVTIEDNGKGFDKDQLPEDAGMGLKNMKARIDYLHGSIDFDTAPGKGTLVAIHLPAGKNKTVEQ